MLAPLVYLGSCVAKSSFGGLVAPQTPPRPLLLRAPRGPAGAPILLVAMRKRLHGDSLWKVVPTPPAGEFGRWAWFAGCAVPLLAECFPWSGRTISRRVRSPGLLRRRGGFPCWLSLPSGSSKTIRRRVWSPASSVAGDFGWEGVDPEAVAKLPAGDVCRPRLRPIPRGSSPRLLLGRSPHKNCKNDLDDQT